MLGDIANDRGADAKIEETVITRNRKSKAQTPNAESPSRWRMNGDRKSPTNILFPKANQLEPMFLMICRFSILCIDTQPADAADITRRRGSDNSFEHAPDESLPGRCFVVRVMPKVIAVARPPPRSEMQAQPPSLDVPSTNSYPNHRIRCPHACSICNIEASGSSECHPPAFALRTNRMSWRVSFVALKTPA